MFRRAWHALIGWTCCFLIALPCDSAHTQSASSWSNECLEADGEETSILQERQASRVLQLRERSANASNSDVIKSIHILSMGREGSCFFLDIFKASNPDKDYPVIFEPLNGIVEGSGTLHQSLTGGSHVKCLYDCQTCSPGDVREDSLEALQEYCSQPQKQLLFMKTTRIIDSQVLVDVPLEQLMQTRFVVLFRDPRGVWASTKPMTSWAIHSISHICNALMLKAFSLPDLVAQVGGDRVHPVFFEEWALDTKHEATNLADLMGADERQRQLMEAFAAEAQRNFNISWLEKLDAEEVQEIESNPQCRAYMERMGYPMGQPQDASDASFYAAFREQHAAHPEMLFGNLSEEQSELLQEMRQNNALLQQAVPVQLAFEALRHCSDCD